MLKLSQSLFNGRTLSILHNITAVKSFLAYHARKSDHNEI